MRGLAWALVILNAATAFAQSQKVAPRKVVPRRLPEPECAQGAICFVGEVSDGAEFRKAINADFEFVLHLPGEIDVVPRHPEEGCKLSIWIANPPLMAHHPTEIDASYDWTAEDEVQTSPREFNIVENCSQYNALIELVYDPVKADAEKYFEALGALKARGRLWITGSKVTQSRDDDQRKGKIEWLKFAAEIRLPPN